MCEDSVLADTARRRSSLSKVGYQGKAYSSEHLFSASASRETTFNRDAEGAAGVRLAHRVNDARQTPTPSGNAQG